MGRSGRVALAKKRKLTARAVGLYGMVLPAALLLFVFNYVPMYGIIIAFQDFMPFLGPFRSPWVGLKHFIYFLQDAKFWSVMRNTLLINFYDIALGFTAPILFALLANELTQIRFKKTVQTISYLPHFLSWVVVAGMMYQVLSPSENGLVNILLGKLLGIKPIFFMTEINLFRPLVVTLDIWKSVGWGAILYFATIAGVDSSLYEAAYIDGASRLQQVRHVTIPSLLSIVVLLFLLRLSSIFTIGFERIFLLQNPVVYSVADVISTYIYRLGLEQAQFSLTTAIGLVQSVLGFALLLGANRLSSRLAGLGLYLRGPAMLRYRSTSRKIFEVVNVTLFVLFAITITLPFLNVIAISLSGYEAVRRGEVTIFPTEISLDGYKTIVTNLYFLRAVLNSVLITVVNTVLVIAIALMAGYALANKHFVGKGAVFIYFLIPLYFSGGLIPTYVLIANWLRLTNNRLALILPAITNVFYIILFRNSISQLPHEIMDSGEIDGASDMTILFRLVFPIMLPMITAFTIFSAVAYWNEWFGSLLYMQDINKWTLQFRLRDILINSNLRDDPNNPIRARIAGQEHVHPLNLKMAALVVTIVPIVAIYPFLQKYFIHGIIVGAVKG